MRGTVVNAVAILLDSAVGLTSGARLPERLQRIIQEGIGGGAEILDTKAMLDGAASVACSAGRRTLGW
jgi:uncharacterized membrane protein YqgA involved in biofilm formation